MRSASHAGTRPPWRGRSAVPERFIAYLLQTSANRRDPLRVEAKPVHPPDVARVLDLDAPVHYDREAAGLGDPAALFIDHRELTPEALGADRDRLVGDARQRVRRAKDVD